MGCQALLKILTAGQETQGRDFFLECFPHLADTTDQQLPIVAKHSKREGMTWWRGVPLTSRGGLKIHSDKGVS
jgi:hypothetical protein